MPLEVFGSRRHGLSSLIGLTRRSQHIVLLYRRRKGTVRCDMEEELKMMVEH
jgi:hypothetical protein